MSSPAGASDPPLVGREREQTTLRKRLAAALAGRGSLVLIGGEAGIGKTTLAEWLLAEAAGRGALALIGRCYDLSETPPYGPWREAFAQAPRDSGLPILPTAVLPVNREGETLPSQEAIVARVQEFFAALAACRPIAILLLEDLHWADPASLDLLRVIGRGLAELPILLLVTYRADELASHQPLYALLPVLVREARALRLDLRSLDDAALHTLAQRRYELPPADTARLATYLRERAEGNPFYAGELLRALEEERALRPVAGGPGAGDGWHLGDLGAVPMPDLLRQVIDARVARLGAEPARLLALAAVIGQEVPLDLWARVAEAGEEALLAVLEGAVAAHLLVGTPEGGRFAHALVREALYEGVLPVRRRALHRRVAEALLGAPDPDPDAVAYHLGQVGDPRAAAWLVRAGERAARADAWATAAARYEAALALPEARAAPPGQRARLVLTLAELWVYTDPARGVLLTEEAERLATEAGEPNLAAVARFKRGDLRSQAGDRRTGLVEMEGAWSALEHLPLRDRARMPTLVAPGTSPEEDYHRGILVLYLAAAGRCREALALGEPFARSAAVATPIGQQGLAMARALLGDPEGSSAALAAARAAFLAAGQLRDAANTLVQELEWAAHYRSDQPGVLARLAEETERAVLRAAAVAPRASPRLILLPFFWLTGRWDEAHAAARLAGWPPVYRVWIWPGPWFARIARAQGDRDTAWELVHHALPDGPTADPHSEFAQALALHALAATLALDDGDLVVARAWLAARDHLLARSGTVLGRAEGALGWAAYHRAAGDLAAARHHAEQALDIASHPRQPLALLTARHLLGELETMAGRHAEAGTHLDAALALADACAAPYERALTLLALAELRAATGERDEATRLLDDARALLGPLEARPALARADALATCFVDPVPRAVRPNGRTAREAEVLRLVAEGLPDAEVAARLFVSRATVSTHLRAVYGKLGVTSRTAATRLALTHGLT